MNNPLKISVIIPSYKPQSYIWECLDSLCNQTFPKDDFEVILVLNGCKEPYDSQIREYISKHQDVQWNYIQTDQGGVSNARNLALDVAKGEYVTFIDDDDYISESCLSEMYECVNNKTMALCYPYAFTDGVSGQRNYRITDEFEKYYKYGTVKSSKVRKFFSGPCMKLIPMSFIQGRRFDTRFKNGEDTLFMFLISDCFDKVSFTSKNAIYYRRYRSGSAVTVTRNRKEVVSNEWILFKTALDIYINNIRKYNFGFSIKTFLGFIHGMIERPYDKRANK